MLQFVFIGLMSSFSVVKQKELPYPLFPKFLLLNPIMIQKRKMGREEAKEREERRGREESGEERRGAGFSLSWQLAPANSP